jgi:DNA-binding transcriptional LysR family regulator
LDLPGIDDMTFFDQIARSWSLTEAAREWGVSPSAVSKRLTHLETRLQVRLVQRRTRRLTLTEEGTRYAEGVSRLLPQLTDLEESISVQHREPRGRITIHCTFGLGREHIGPMLREFVNQHQQVQVDLELSHLPLNIAGTSFDCAIWVGKLQDSRLKVKLLHPSRRVVCAAPEYLRASGAPTDLPDLENHACIVIRQGDSDFALWRFGTSEDEEESPAFPPRPPTFISSTRPAATHHAASLS